MFFNYNQNNSGGYFIEDDAQGVCEEVIIEADSGAEAWRKLNAIGEKTASFWDFCRCCGERWWDCHDDDSDATKEPEIYGVALADVEAGSYRKNAFVHYKDGTLKKFTHK